MRPLAPAIRAAVVVAGLSLTACGGGSSGTDAAAVRPPAGPGARPVVAAVTTATGATATGSTTVPVSAATTESRSSAAKPAAAATTPTTTATATTAATTTTPTTDGRSLAGRTVVIDPGHNGGNAGAPGAVNAPVSIGNGTKACDTTGTESVRGLAEHRFNWLVAQHVRRTLEAQGARVVLTRVSDTGVGPCITRRMPKANRIGADLAVSIHADGGPASGRGFHVILPGRVPRIDGHDRIVAPSARLGRAVRAAFRRGTGMPYSTYLGSRGLDVRTDLGGLNLIRVPGVMIETGNMRNATDAALMGDPKWRRRAGRAIAAGVADGLLAVDR